MSDEPEHTQDHGALAAVTAQRDRLRRYVRAIFTLDTTLDDDTAEAGKQFAAQIEEMHAARAALLPSDWGDEA